MSTRIRTLVAATAAVVAVALLAGCSLLPGSAGTKTPPKAPAAAKGASKTPKPKPASGAEATTAPALRKVVPVSQDIDGIQLRQLVDQGALLIDVRPRHDFDKEHIKGAVSIPMRIFVSNARKWNQVRPIVVYDQTGAEAQTAQTWLEQQGFMAVFHLYRGLDGYDDTLVGKSPTPIPPKRPVLYYFYTSSETSCGASTKFVSGLRQEFPGEFEYHGYDASTVSGKAQLLEFGGVDVPTFRFIDERGHTQQFYGSEDFSLIRALLKRAVEAYEESTKS